MKEAVFEFEIAYDNNDFFAHPTKQGKNVITIVFKWGSPYNDKRQGGDTLTCLCNYNVQLKIN